MARSRPLAQTSRSAHHGAGRVCVALPKPAESGKVDPESGVHSGEVSLILHDLAHDAADDRGVLELVAARADGDEEPFPLGAIVNRGPVVGYVVGTGDAQRFAGYAEFWKAPRGAGDL